MKVLKGVGLFFAIIGIFFALVGTIKYILVLNDIENRIYTTATIVEIDEYLTDDPDNPKGYNVYVEFEVDDDTVRSELNTYSYKYYVGGEISIYYYENDMNIVYAENSEHLLLIFPLVGISLSILGFILFFNKKVQNHLLRLPVSEAI
jgi:hypothetical protein